MSSLSSTTIGGGYAGSVLRSCSTSEERETLERWARRPKSSQALALRCRIVLAAAEGRSSTEIAAELGLYRFDGRPVAGPVREARAGWVARRAAAGQAAHDQRRGRGAGDREDARGAAGQRDALVDAVDGGRDRDEPDARSAGSGGRSGSSRTRPRRSSSRPDPQFIDKVSDIVGLYLNPPEAAVVLCVDEKSQIQALDRSAPVLPLMPGVPARADPRLHPQRHHQPLRRPRRRLGAGARRDDAAASRRGVPPLPQPDRRLGAGAPRRARRARQLLDPQDPVDPALAGPPSALHAPFHADLQLLAEPRRALVRRTDDEVDQAKRPPLRPRPGRLDPHLDHQLERRPEAIRLAQERRRDPRQPRRLLPADQRLRSSSGRPIASKTPRAKASVGAQSAT